MIRFTFWLTLFALVVVTRPPVTCAQEAIAPDTKYADAVRALETFIVAEMAAKEVPGLSVALVDGDKIVWAKGFGVSHEEKGTKATAATPYPLGSVSKLLTSLLLLQLVREGKVNLDDPVTKYLPGFKPESTFTTPVTIRHLLAHCSGIVREPPVGNFFSPGKATPADMVASLNKTSLIYEPGTQYKYSNAAFGVAGHLLETVAKAPFHEIAQQRLFQPLGMTRSSFQISERLKGEVALGQGWTRYGKTFPIPTTNYEALAPAGNAVASVADVGKLLMALMPNPKAKGPFHPDDLHAAYTRQFPSIKAERNYGLGFIISELHGKKKVSHGGAVNGCVAEFALLPDERLGVIVCATKESANMLTRRLAETILTQALAVRGGQALPALESTKPLTLPVVQALAGRYQAKSDVLDVIASGNRAWLVPAAGGPMKEIRAFKDTLIVDDALSYGTKVAVEGKTLRVDGMVYERVAMTKPQPMPDKWAGFVGEYGPESNVVFILEKDGQLHLLIEWFFLYPLKEEAPNRFRLPNSGLYPGETVVFHRKDGGKATSITAAAMTFERRAIDGEDGATFKIKPVRAMNEIREEAVKAKPPVEKGEFVKPDLVDLATVDKTFKFDIRYATDNNFMGTTMYSLPKAFLQRPAAEALARASKKLAPQGYGILVFDCYRPWYVTKMFWEATPEKQRIFVADPSKGSRHNRGCAADITLYDLKTGKPVDMVSGFDEFSDRAYPDYLGGTSLQRWYRQLLRDTMEAEGFTVYEAEWWHYDFKDWRKYPILNEKFEDLK